MQIVAGRWVHAFQFRREGMSCFSEVWRFVYLCHDPQKLPSVVRQELWLARACFCCYERICACLWIPWSWLATPACWAEPHAGRQSPLREDFSPLHLPHVICIGDELGAGQRACELLQMCITPFSRTLANPRQNAFASGPGLM